MTDHNPEPLALFHALVIFFICAVVVFGLAILISEFVVRSIF